MTDRQLQYMRVIAHALEHLTRAEIAEVIRGHNDSYCTPYELELALHAITPLPDLEEAIPQ